MQLNGKTALITGGGSGIGAAIGRRFANEGAAIAVADVDQEAATRIADEIIGHGGRAIALELDVRDPSAVKRVATKAADELGVLDVLVTSAGVSRREPLMDTSPESWDEVFAINVRGTFLCAQAVIPDMVTQGHGSIITVASQLAFAGGRGNPAYVASKGAIVSLTRSLALDFAETGVRVNALVPGATVTPLMENGMARQANPEAVREASRNRHAMKRFGQPDEVAYAALYLASDEARFVTGTMMPIDGGWLVA